MNNTDDMNKPIAITREQVSQWLQRFHQRTGTLTELVGDVDHNFRLTTADRHQTTVKISTCLSPDDLAFEAALLSHLGEHQHEALSLPRPINDTANRWLTPLPTTSPNHLMRLLSWVDGHLWSAFSPHTPQLIKHLGQQMARLDQVLSDFEHPGASRELSWDLMVAEAGWTRIT